MEPFCSRKWVCKSHSNAMHYGKVVKTGFEVIKFEHLFLHCIFVRTPMSRNGVQSLKNRLLCIFLSPIFTKVIKERLNELESESDIFP